MIGFLIRRPDAAGNPGTDTHWWVRQELAIASQRDLKILPVREDGLVPQQGITGSYQWIDFRLPERDKCLVEIAKALGKWQRKSAVPIELLPASCVTEIRQLLKKRGFRASYQLLDEATGEESELKEASVVPRVPGGLVMYAKEVGCDAVLRVQIEAMGQRWTSDYKAMDVVGVQMVKE